jgi:hypothetical protein
MPGLSHYSRIVSRSFSLESEDRAALREAEARSRPRLSALVPQSTTFGKCELTTSIGTTRIFAVSPGRDYLHTR